MVVGFRIGCVAVDVSVSCAEESVSCCITLFLRNTNAGLGIGMYTSTNVRKRVFRFVTDLNQKRRILGQGMTLQYWCSWLDVYPVCVCLLLRDAVLMKQSLPLRGR